MSNTKAISQAYAEYPKPKTESNTKEPQLTNKMMDDMGIKIFEAIKGNHNCGVCNMRVEGNPARCTILTIPIDLRKGTCNFQATGEAATKEDIHETRLRPETAGYVEYNGKIQCTTCEYFDGKDYCKVWIGKASPQQCCMAWDNKEAKL